MKAKEHDPCCLTDMQRDIPDFTKMKPFVALETLPFKYFPQNLFNE